MRDIDTDTHGVSGDSRLDQNNDVLKAYKDSINIASTSSGKSDGSRLFDAMFNADAMLAAKEGVQSSLFSSAALPENTSLAKTSSVAEKPGVHISTNQYTAIKKFPSLVEMLGRDGVGDKLANSILSEVRQILIAQIQDNSQSHNKYAQVCIAERQNIKQWFRGNDWVCCVTASGPFRGDEIIHYKKESDAAYILRKSENDFVDVSNEFNLIFDLAEGVEEDIPEINDENTD